MFMTKDAGEVRAKAARQGAAATNDTNTSVVTYKTRR